MSGHRTMPTTRPTTAAARALGASVRPDLRPLLVFAALALGVGGGFLALSTLFDPGAPFILAAVYLGLAAPALVLTYREAGSTGLRALLRDCLRRPRSARALLMAGFVVPSGVSALGILFGAARPITISVLVTYLVDLVVGLVVVNLAEELAWTGFFQRRAMMRWGATGGSLVTTAFFTFVHVPLAVRGVHDVGQAITNISVVGLAALGLRLLIGVIDTKTSGSLLAVGLLHASFNSGELLLAPGYDWVRVVAVVVVALVLVVVGAIRAHSLERASGHTL